MIDHDIRTLLERGVPEPPPGQYAPPLETIRRKARSRQLVIATAAVVLVAVTVVGGTTVLHHGSHTDLPPAAAGRASWSFATVGIDDKTLTVVGGPSRAQATCAVTPAARLTPGQNQVSILVSVPTRQTDCVYQVPLHLDEPLGDRIVIDAAARAPRPVLHDQLLPRPTYPAGVALDTQFSHLTLNAPGPSWSNTYTGHGLTITIDAIPVADAPTFPPGQPLTVHGHQIHIVQFTPDTGTAAVWYDGDWQIGLTATDGAGTLTNIPTAELLHILNGLVWQ